MPNDITVTKNETAGSERWDVEYTADQAATVTKTLDTAGTMLDRDIKVSITTPAGSAVTPATAITANTTISVSSGGLITATASASQSVTPNVSAGFVSAGTAGTIAVTGSKTSQLSTQAAQTIHPSTSDQTIASGKYLTGTQTIKAVALSNLSAGNIKKDVVVKVGDTDDDDRIISVTGTYEGSGGSVQRGVLRPDAELVGKWTMDQYVVADLGLTIPSYTTSTTTFRLSQNIDTYVGDPLTYRYFITARALTTPKYSITTLAKGRQEYSMGFAQYEWLYNSSGQMQSLDGSKSYGAYSLIQGYASTREIYWSSATGISVYTSDAYCARQGLATPTIASNKTITIKSPSIALRGDATYLTQTFFDAMTDIRCQYVIELWRVPLTGVDGWAHGTQMDSIFNDINNNGGTLT